MAEIVIDKTGEKTQGQELRKGEIGKEQHGTVGIGRDIGKDKEEFKGREWKGMGGKGMGGKGMGGKRMGGKRMGGKGMVGEEMEDREWEVWEKEERGGRER